MLFLYLFFVVFFSFYLFWLSHLLSFTFVIYVYTFSYILNYLRTRKIHLPETLVELQQLKDEVDFYQIPTLKEEVCMELARRHEESMVKLLPPNCDSDGYFLDVVEINTVKANMKSLQLIAHADVIRVLPLNPEDYAILQALMEVVKCTDYHPQKSNTGHMWVYGQGLL